MFSPLFVTNVSSISIALICLVAVALLLHLHERATGRFIAHHLGWRGVLITAWIGVPLHELSHLILALLFRHRIIAWKLFDPDPVTGTLGYVRHAPSRDTLYQRAGNFFIGIGPLLGGGVALAALLWWALPGFGWMVALERLVFAPTTLQTLPATALSLLGALLGFGQQIVVALWSERTVALPLQLYLGGCVACHLSPSRADLRAALTGSLITAVALLLAALLAATWNLSFSGCLAALPLLTFLLLLSSTFQVLYVSLVSLCCRSLRRGQQTQNRERLNKVVS